MPAGAGSASLRPQLDVNSTTSALAACGLGGSKRRRDDSNADEALSVMHDAIGPIVQHPVSTGWNVPANMIASLQCVPPPSPAAHFPPNNDMMIVTERLLQQNISQIPALSIGLTHSAATTAASSPSYPMFAATPTVSSVVAFTTSTISQHAASPAHSGGTVSIHSSHQHYTATHVTSTNAGLIQSVGSPISYKRARADTVPAQRISRECMMPSFAAPTAMSPTNRTPKNVGRLLLSPMDAPHGMVSCAVVAANVGDMGTGSGGLDPQFFNSHSAMSYPSSSTNIYTAPVPVALPIPPPIRLRAFSAAQPREISQYSSASPQSPYAADGSSPYGRRVALQSGTAHIVAGEEAVVTDTMRALLDRLSAPRTSPHGSMRSLNASSLVSPRGFTATTNGSAWRSAGGDAYNANTTHGASSGTAAIHAAVVDVTAPSAYAHTVHPANVSVADCSIDDSVGMPLELLYDEKNM